MRKESFLEYEKPILTVMVQADNPDRIEELIKASLPEGAEAFGMQFCRMKKEFRNKKTYLRLMKFASPYPTYVTNYRHHENEGKSDDTLAQELIELAECGATLCDLTGDLFDKQPGEFTENEEAVKKQTDLIEKLHKAGAEVMISSHILKFTPGERILQIAREYERRGADICKFVTGADTMAEQIENFKIMDMLKRNLKIPFLFLSSGECRLTRRIGGEFGSCMYLCVKEHDEFSTQSQPLLADIKKIRDLL